MKTGGAFQIQPNIETDPSHSRSPSSQDASKVLADEVGETERKFTTNLIQMWDQQWAVLNRTERTGLSAETLARLDEARAEADRLRSVISGWDNLPSKTKATNAATSPSEDRTPAAVSESLNPPQAR